MPKPPHVQSVSEIRGFRLFKEDNVYKKKAGSKAYLEILELGAKREYWLVGEVFRENEEF